MEHVNFFSRKILVRGFKLAAAAGLLFSLSGCLLTSPYWNQVFDSHTDSVPMQAWTTDSGSTITFQCAQASHGGLYPYWGPTWHHVANVNPALPGSVDSFGTRIYSAARNHPLPNNCWRQDPANGVWYAAVRALQDGDEYNTFDISGLECLGRENGAAASWLGWLGDGCTKTYSNSNNNIPYVIFRANS